MRSRKQSKMTFLGFTTSFWSSLDGKVWHAWIDPKDDTGVFIEATSFGVVRKLAESQIVKLHEASKAKEAANVNLQA